MKNSLELRAFGQTFGREPHEEARSILEFDSDTQKAELTRFLRFAATGVLNTAVDFTAFLVLSYWGAGVFWAQTLAYLTGMLNSYAVNRRWTFSSREKFLGPVMLRFAAANLSLLALSLGVIWLVHGQLEYSKIAAKICATALTVTLGFAINRLWVFKR